MRADGIWRYATLLPAILFFALLTFLPLANLVALSFHNVEWVDGKAMWDWVGVENFLSLPQDNLLRAGILNTVIFAVVAVALQMIIGFFLAHWTTQVTRGRLFYRTIFILPILVPGIIIGAIWKLMYSYDFGVINTALGVFGIGPVDWLGNPNLSLISVIIVDVWHWTPFCFLLLLAGLESLPKDVFEAARVDGATDTQILRYITLPLMLPTLIVTFVFRMILAFKVFDEIYLLTGGGPGTSTEVISFTIYRRFFTEDQVGYGAAMSIAVIVLITVMIIAATRTTTRKADHS